MSEFEWNRILHGDVLAKIEEIPDKSIDCVVTSPPYYGLRDYKVKGQIGLESTFHDYIDKMVNVFEVLKSKLCDHGSLWVNLGDTYYGGGNAQGHVGLTTNLGKSTLQRDGNQTPVARGKLLPRKTLIGIPDRFKIKMIDEGWICRNDIIWWKRSTMPSSAKDRFTVDYERFFFFTKKSKYYFNQQFTPIKEDNVARLKRGNSDTHKGLSLDEHSPFKPHSISKPRKDTKYNDGHSGYYNEDGSLRVSKLGANMRTVWSIEGINELYHEFIMNNLSQFNNWLSNLEFDHNSIWDISTAQFKNAHFATFPEKLIEVPIDASCPKLVCTECGEPQKQIIEAKGGTVGKSWHDHSGDLEKGMHQVGPSLGDRKNEDGHYKREIIGWSKCGCEAPFRKGRVLDPFMGAGTTALVAHKQNKDWLGIELKEEYIKIANLRLLNNTDILLQRHFEFD
jgi:site-specific DNA-methyltransferase (adenine-specific)